MSPAGVLLLLNIPMMVLALVLIVAINVAIVMWPIRWVFIALRGWYRQWQIQKAYEDTDNILS